MNQNKDFHLRYPIGIYQSPESIDAAMLHQWIDEIASLPQRLQNLVAGMTDKQLDQPYRPGGWTARQVIHHLPDSHLNAYTRFKLALTEDKPVIKPYNEGLWAELPEAKAAPIASSLVLLDALHARWSQTIRNLSEDQLQRSFIHPESREEVILADCVGNYAWHGNHHFAHVEGVKKLG